jgi:predicted phage terminase large subunit-like protein
MRRPVSGRDAVAVLVEDKANGPSVIQRLKVNIPGVVEINPQGGKVARMFAAAPEWQSGDWVLSRNASWTEPFIEQITTSPAGRYDDMADAMSHSAWLLQPDTITVSNTNAFTGHPIDW